MTTQKALEFIRDIMQLGLSFDEFMQHVESALISHANSAIAEHARRARFDAAAPGDGVAHCIDWLDARGESATVDDYATAIGITKSAAQSRLLYAVAAGRARVSYLSDGGRKIKTYVAVRP